jgi:hypothetical protein
MLYEIKEKLPPKYIQKNYIFLPKVAPLNLLSPFSSSVC